jgi:dihydroneopterin aldolase / 2-amino-4-hydroxy-6-hydroxymethyldihydropteridine diphosphokinase
VSAHPLGPALDDAGHPLDQVALVGISATGHHGVFEHERREGQTFVADVVVHLDTRRAAATDDLTRTVHYGVLAEAVHAVLAGEPADLVETVAERIAATALADPLVVAVDVAVHKPSAPITVPFRDVVVRIRRDRQKLPAAEPWTPPAHSTTPAATGGGPDTAGSGAGAGGGPADGRTQPGQPDRLDEVPPVPVDAVLALGSNLGAPQSTLRTAVEDLGALDGVEVVAVSPLARTAPVGGPDQPDFLNAVVLVRTTLSARALLHAAQSVEAKHGRERHERWGPRTLDVDLITYDSTLAVTDDLELPHPRAHQRAFVLQPWAQVAPDAVLPGLGGGPVAALAATAPDRDGIRWLALDWMTAPAQRGTEGSPSGSTPHVGDPER